MKFESDRAHCAIINVASGIARSCRKFWVSIAGVTTFVLTLMVWEEYTYQAFEKEVMVLATWDIKTHGNWEMTRPSKTKHGMNCEGNEIHENHSPGRTCLDRSLMYPTTMAMLALVK